MRLFLLSLVALTAAACSSGGQKQAPQPPPPPRVSTAPAGPTRTDFQTIAKKLVARCVAGGWIDKWRSEQPDVDVARPRIYLREFEDRTQQNLDPSYLGSVLERRMILSGVYDMVSQESEHDFVGRGRLLRLAEETGAGRISVYTAVLEMLEPKTDRVAYSCEATVEGEM